MTADIRRCRARFSGLSVLLLLAWVPAAWAGGGCETADIEPSAVAKGFETGLHVFQRLEELAPEAALLGRVGSDLSKHGLRFSHMGLVVRDHPAGRFTVVHLLNDCGTDQLDLYDQGLADFFLDGPFVYDAWLVIPDADLQRSLAELSRSPVAQALLAKRYNMVAPPVARRSQNSNGWLLEILGAAIGGPADIRSRGDLRRLGVLRGFEPDEVRITLLDRLGSGFQANVDPGEQPWRNRRRGRAEIVTVRSIVRWLRQQGRLHSEEILLPPT